MLTHYPALKTPGYFRMSLRDKAVGLAETLRRDIMKLGLQVYLASLAV